MKIIEYKPIPIYELECVECHSKIQYKKSEISLTYSITCPVCGISNWAYSFCPVRYEEKNKEDL